MAFQDRLNMNKRATVPQTPYTTERYEKEIALSSKASAEATDVNIKHRVEKVQSGNTSGESRFFDKVVEENTPYVKFTALQDDSLVRLVGPNPTWLGHWNFETSYDCKVWTSCPLGTTINLNNGEYVYLRGLKDSVSQTVDDYHMFMIMGTIAASGDVTSLLNGTGGVLDLTPYGDYTFYSMFSAWHLVSVPILPSMILTANCYNSMFKLCTHLMGTVTISATSPYYTGTTSACTDMFTSSSTEPGAGGTIKVGGNVNLWNQANCGIDSTKWTVELIQ